MDSDKIAHDIAMLYLSRQYDEIKNNHKEIFKDTISYIDLANVLASEYMCLYSETISIINAKQKP